MSKESNEIEIRFLDHVALRVRDMDISADWYQNVLGLKKYQLPEWGEAPIFLLSGKSGIALFPARLDDQKLESTSKSVKIDHFAFNVTADGFEKAVKKFGELKLDFEIKDHHYFHSVYIKDPDGHTVELTTIVVDENDFYR